MKKFLSLTLVCAMALTMVVGCGAGAGADSAEAGSADSTYVIGSTGPLTGDASSYGNSVKNGATIAVDEINANGGLNGVNFSFVMKDDKADAAEAASAYDALMDSGMQISIGSVTSGSCEAFAARAMEDNVFFITPSASAASVIENRPNAFRVCFGDPDQGTLAAQNLTSNYSAIGCIYDTSDTYSSGIYAAFEAEMQNLGVEFEVRTFDADNKTDFSAQVEALKDCEVIFLPIYYTEAGLIARACTAKELNNIALFGCDGLDGVAAQIDESVKNPISYITPFDAASTAENSAKFVKAYEEKFGATPDQFAADGYDAIYAIYNAMKAANVNDVNIAASDLCNAVVASITADSFKYDGVTGSMTWDASGACTKDPVIVVLQ